MLQVRPGAANKQIEIKKEKGKWNQDCQEKY